MVTALFAHAASSFLGTLWPAYKSYKAIKNRDIKEYKRWMQYWTCFGLFLVIEMIADFFVWWFPFYYEAKLLVVVYLLVPYFHGPTTIFSKVVKPTLDHHEQDIDSVLLQLDKHGYALLPKVLDFIRVNVLGILVSQGSDGDDDDDDERDGQRSD
eukprot:TRINITY_DN1059_c0_g1_i1.p1 TRINITY_DN1059_c0_g1~~TRINITY_DN1059_c0_g1_i1.p1  ORF type:complete len:155 (+),score=34.36 TRINITY_DN1059_c0_g1_i1:125-589(+)